jgi:cytochrome c-type biogenesis protein CcmF
MQYLTQLYLPGALALWCALIFAVVSFASYLQLAAAGAEGGRDSAAHLFPRRAFAFYVLSILLAAGVLFTLLLRQDYRIEYVSQYTGVELPWFYLLSAFWAGQKGSFLIWIVAGALLGLLLFRTAGREEAPVMATYILTQLGLLFIVVRESPFLMLDTTPVDGSGLNPLLQDPWMVIHPPVMFVGYAASAIPFSFAVAALFRRRYDRWAHLAFPWALGGFLVLGTAILLGGYWAYKTLGWGGYWGWDPVENASLIPWLIGTVLIHGLHMERQKGRYRRANLVLACLLFLSVLYGTFLTRSGVLADFSVHSFVDLGISNWLVAGMAFWGLGSLWLLVTRLREVPTNRNEDPLLSRGSFLVLSTITLSAATLVVAVGTSAPLITRLGETPSQVGPSFYNRVNQPLALLIAALLAIVPYLTWRGTPAAEVGRKILPAAGFALLVAVGAGVAGVHQPLHLLFVLLASLAVATNLQRTLEKARAGGLKAAGGYLAHIGVGVILLGILASSAYDESAKVTLQQGVPAQVQGLTLTFERFVPRTADEKEHMEVAVQREDGSSYTAYPKMFVNDRTQQIMAHPHVQSLALQDVYISPIEFDPGEPGGSKRVHLAKGEAVTVAGRQVRFAGFDLGIEGNALAQMQNGGKVALGATLEVTQSGRTETVTPIYRFSGDGRVEAPPSRLPGGGDVLLSAIDATSGAVQLDFVGVEPAGAGAKLASLSVDVTRKPLIRLVWYGLYVVLLGGILATSQRLRQAFVLERVPSRAPRPLDDAS